MRKRHYLKRIKSTQLPNEFIYFDSETLPEAVSLTETRLIFRLAVAVHVVYRDHRKITSTNWSNFTDSEALWRWIDSKTHNRSTVYVVAHNAEFDFRVTKGFTNLVGLGWSIRRFFLDGGKFTVWWQRDTRSIIVLDSMQLLPASLAMLGEMFELPKAVMPAYDASNEYWFPYCRRDVEVLQRGLDLYRNFIDVNRLGGMAKTTAGQAFRAYRHRFMTEDIEIHNDPDALRLERDGYYGGRTECFRLGNLAGGDLYVLDVRSMYPTVMRDGVYPVQLISYAEGVPIYRLRQLVKRYHLVADVDIDTDDPIYPLRFNNRLIFPVGRFRTVLNGVELEHALANKHVKRCHRAAIYFKAAIFADYVTALYNLRNGYQRKRNVPFGYLTKLLLNSLYGKFGQRGYIYDEIGSCEPDACWSMEVVIDGESEPVTEFAFGGKVYIRRRTEEAYDSFPAISAAVTSYARLRLWELIEKAGRENVFYVDTDSVMVNATGYQCLHDEIDPDRLGGLHVDRIANKVVIYGLKDYAIEGRRTVKGVKSKSIRVGEHEWIEERWERFHSALRRGTLEDYRIMLSPKRLTLPYTKGVVNPDGSIEPFRFVKGALPDASI